MVVVIVVAALVVVVVSLAVAQLLFVLMWPTARLTHEAPSERGYLSLRRLLFGRLSAWPADKEQPSLASLAHTWISFQALGYINSARPRQTRSAGRTSRRQDRRVAKLTTTTTTVRSQTS